MTLDDIAVILGCSKPTASQIRSGKYPTENTTLTERYARLVAVELAGECQRIMASNGIQTLTPAVLELAGKWMANRHAVEASA